MSDVASRFGLDVVTRGGATSAGPCPLCGDAKRHTRSKDKRGALGLRPDGIGWRCFQCDAHGDAAALAAACVLGTVRPVGDAWADVRRACAERGLCEADLMDGRPAAPVRFVPPPPRVDAPPVRPKVSELLDLWTSGLPVHAAALSSSPGDAAAAAYVAGRGVSLGDLALFEPALCRILPSAGSFPSWWPASWAARWRWAVLAYEPNGEIGSIHARAVVDGGDGEPKTRWPKGAAAGGLLFANGRGLALLRGEASGAESVLVTEGLSDTVRAAVHFAQTGRRIAVLGVTSGAAAAFRAVQWPAGVPCLVATDADAAGEKYAREINEALPPSVKVGRVRIGGRDV